MHLDFRIRSVFSSDSEIDSEVWHEERWRQARYTLDEVECSMLVTTRGSNDAGFRDMLVVPGGPRLELTLT